MSEMRRRGTAYMCVTCRPGPCPVSRVPGLSSRDVREHFVSYCEHICLSPHLQGQREDLSFTGSVTGAMFLPRGQARTQSYLQRVPESGNPELEQC